MDPNSQESPLDAAELAAAQSAWVKGPLKGLWRAVSINEVNMILAGLEHIKNRNESIRCKVLIQLEASPRDIYNNSRLLL